MVAALERVAKRRGYPQMITVDKGSEVPSKTLDAWTYAHGVQLDFIRPGNPVENAMIERFKGRFRDECLTRRCSSRCTRPDRRLKRGGSITVSTGRMVRSGICPPRVSRTSGPNRAAGGIKFPARRGLVFREGSHPSRGSMSIRFKNWASGKRSRWCCAMRTISRRVCAGCGGARSLAARK